MNYIPKEFEEIFESMLNDSLEKGLISHAEEFPSYIANQEDISNYYVMDKAVIAQMFVKFYDDLTAVYESSKVEYAEGEDLDNIGDYLGITRPAATSASVLVTFTLNSVEEGDVTIPEGVIVSNNQGIEYVTVEDLYFPIGEVTCTVQCMSMEQGVSVKVVENTLNTVVSDTGYPLECTNPSSSNGGTDAYSDDEYRYLLLNWSKINLRGSQEAYEYYFADVDGIEGYRLIPNWNGTGTLKIVVDPGTPSLLNSIYDELQNNISQATEDISLFAPIEKSIDVHVIINVDIDLINVFSTLEKEEIKSRIISSIKTFIDGGYLEDGDWYPGLGIGEDFIPHKLAVFLDDEIPELKNISFNYPQDYISITDEEKGVSNDVIVEMI